MSKIVAVLAVTMFALAGTASARSEQDFRSPDARPAVVMQDYRSPDARPATGRHDPGMQDLRSPDARVAGPVAPKIAKEAPDASSRNASSSSFEWGYLALGTAMVLIGIGGLALVQRRRRHGLATGG
jgi:hypothetical protein